mmetsp:Transcript_2838/g.2364  ORF Transcript_2838/g.2364 Transcript_2838/m.2364 type:complete len:256 (-) Transcript_2838:85-852(-)
MYFEYEDLGNYETKYNATYTSYNSIGDINPVEQCLQYYLQNEYIQYCNFTNGNSTWKNENYQEQRTEEGYCNADENGELCCNTDISIYDQNIHSYMTEQTEEGPYCEAFNQQNEETANNQESSQDNQNGQDPNNEGDQINGDSQNSNDDEDEQSNTNDDLNENGNNHQEDYSQGQGLVANAQYSEEFVEACGCGDHPELALPQDNLGFISLEGPLIYCPTVCWIEDNIIDLLYKHVFVPIEGDVSYNTVGDQISS